MAQPQPALDEKIKDEDLRHRVRELMQEPFPRWWRFLNAPLIVAIVVALIAPFLINYYNKKQQEIAREQADYEARVNAIKEFSKLIYERYTRSTLLASSIYRDASVEELHRRKMEYDEVFVDYDANLMANGIMFRDLSDQQSYSKFEDYLGKGLTRVFGHIDNCLTKLYDSKVNNQPMANGNNCNPPKRSQSTGCYESVDLKSGCCRYADVHAELDLARTCGNAIIQGLYDYVRYKRMASQGQEVPKDYVQTIESFVHCKCGIQ